jgi:hypothetical protein
MLHEDVRYLRDRGVLKRKKGAFSFLCYCGLLLKCCPMMCGTRDDKGVKEGEGRLFYFEK